jgi:hypothetical protein
VTKLSSARTRFQKRIFPVIWFGFLAFFLAITLTTGVAAINPVAVVVPLVMGVFGYFLFRHLVFDLVDEVYDCGDELLVRNGGVEERLPLSNIINVSATMMVNPPRITLRLDRPGRFGPEIAFSPVTRFGFRLFARNPIAEDLILRVDRARVKRAAAQLGR